MATNARNINWQPEQSELHEMKNCSQYECSVRAGMPDFRFFPVQIQNTIQAIVLRNAHVTLEYALQRMIQHPNAH